MGKCKFLVRGIALAAAVALANQTGAAQAKEYPCVSTMFAPKNEKRAALGARNAQAAAERLAQAYRTEVSRDALMEFDGLYYNMAARGLDFTDDVPATVVQKSDQSRRENSVEYLLTQPLWPAFYDDFISALSSSLGAVSYRTITPTCPTKYESGANAYNRRHITYFLMPDGTIAQLKQVTETLNLSIGDIEKRAKIIKKARSNFFLYVSLTGFPIFPLFSQPVHTILPNDPNSAFYSKKMNYYQNYLGYSAEEVLALDEHHRQTAENKLALWRRCGVLKDGYARNQCLDGPKLEGPSFQLSGNIIENFDYWTEIARLTFGTSYHLASLQSQANYRALQSQWAADERRERVRRRANGGGSILAGVAAGLNNAAGSMARDNQRAATAANDRYRAQYGCAPGQCASTSSSSSTSRADVTRSASSPSSTRLTNGSDPSRDTKAGPREVKRFNYAESAIIKDGKPTRTDAEMCSKISVGDSHGLSPIISKEPCSCSDRSMGRKVRLCEVWISYSSPVIDPEAAKKGSDAR